MSAAAAASALRGLSPLSWEEVKTLAEALTQFIQNHDDLEPPGTPVGLCMTEAQVAQLAVAERLLARYDAVFAALAE
mgnify:CR=1 FL=1